MKENIFQFSLWDSEKETPLRGIGASKNFQFSLWDSQLKAGTIKESLTVSFNSLYEIRWSPPSVPRFLWGAFQFSLWDSRINRQSMLLPLLSSFNSLYEILKVLKESGQIINITFNSLYEIQLLKFGGEYKIAIFLSILFMRFFSFWMEKKLHEKIAFNSLYEIPRGIP